jgi:hypothetical protein
LSYAPYVENLPAGQFVIVASPGYIASLIAAN